MILIVGGLAAGKRAYARDVLGYGPADFTTDSQTPAPVLSDLQNLPEAKLEDLLQKEVIICNEVGCGLVPIQAEERQRREAVGRLCCQLAERAEAVYRISCGLAIRLK